MLYQGFFVWFPSVMMAGGKDEAADESCFHWSRQARDNRQLALEDAKCMREKYEKKYPNSKSRLAYRGIGAMRVLPGNLYPFKLRRIAPKVMKAGAGL